ncbi:MAG: monovalent cation/H+ antiporter subunit D [Rubrimonas sp.]
MSHWIVAPILLPALLAPLMVLAMRHDLLLQRIFSVAGTVALVALGAALTAAAAAGPESYEMGNWPAPFGIVLVLDRLSAMLVLLTATLALGVLAYVLATGWDARGRHFHPLFQFQLMGVCGAFLTGDLFNLFVFFEILLIASYGLMLHGGGALRLRAGVQYVVVNLVGSTLFLFAVGAIYSVTGTLNMADLALKAASVAPGDAGILRAGGLMLLAVFGVKAALVPLHFWLPATYANASAPVAALFAIMTKVGAYAILRVYTLIFGGLAGDAAWLAADWVIPAAIVTLAVGALGVLGARDLRGVACFGAIASMGTLLVAVGGFTAASATAALYYMIHSTFAAAALFLLAEQVAVRRGDHGDRLTTAPAFAQGDLIGGLFFLAAIGLAGMPPLSGFLGKLMVLDAAQQNALMWWIWGAVLGGSLLIVVGFARAGALLFWKSASVPAGRAAPAGDAPSTLPLAAAGLMLVGLVATTVFAGPLTDYLQAAAFELHTPKIYIEAVLGPQGG